jgi:hypothetical protein
MKLTLKYLILIFFISGFSQEKDSSNLKLSFTGTKTHKIDLQDYGESKMMIIVSKPYATNFEKNESEEIQKLLKINTENSKNKLLKIIENNKKYSRDTLIIQNKNSLIKVVNDLMENWKSIENNLTTNPDKRIILDGYTVKLSLMNDQHSYDEIYAHSPTKESHPEIFELISELEKYIKKKI